MICTKKYFTTQDSYAVRLTTLAFEIVDPLVGPFILNAPLPFVPLGWMQGAGGPPAEFSTNMATSANQNLFKSLLEGIIPATMLSVATKPNQAIPANFGPTCLNTIFENYPFQYFGNLNATGDDWQGNGSYLDNYNPHRCPGAMVSQFWFDEDTTPALSTLYSRLWKLVQDIQKITDPRLWAPSGEFSFDVSWHGEPIVGGADSLLSAYTDPGVGNNLGLAFVAMELKSIE